MFKAIVMIKRKPGTSHEDFVKYYEEFHSVLGASKVPNLKKYIRHHIEPYGDGTYTLETDAPYDVITEIWFDDEEDFNQGMAYLSDPAAAAEIAQDELKFMDRASIRFYTMKNYETDLATGKSVGQVD
ncbi:MAG: EthD domain-containing protein [Sphingobium sp.]